MPGKNVAEVGGIPLVARTVQAALAARHVSRVVVSTDDLDIAAAARRAGAEIAVRPVELAGDGATSESAVLHALDTLDGADRHDIVLLVQCTSPFLTASDLDAVAEPLLADEADSAFTAARTHGFLWHPDGTGVNHDPTERLRRQDRPVELLETGAAYAMRIANLRTHGHRFIGRIRPIEVDAARTLEIDEPADLERARLLARGSTRTAKIGQRWPTSMPSSWIATAP